jgi:hypothetical protein
LVWLAAGAGGGITHGTEKLREFDVPPPGSGFTTSMAYGPVPATALAGILAVTKLPLATVVGMPLPAHCTVVPERKFEPTTLKVKAAPPCSLLFGDIAWMVGGFGGGGTTLEPPPHPS